MITHRDTRIQAIYLSGDAAARDRPTTVATALMAAARVILAERLNVQAIEFTDADELILFCDAPGGGEHGAE